MTTPKHTPVGDLRCHTDPNGQTQCEVDGFSAESAPCVDGRQDRWVSPGDSVHGRSEQVAEYFTDGGSTFARLTNGNVVPVCPGSTPSNATHISGAQQGVSVGQVTPMADQSPSPDLQGVSPQQVCPPGWTMAVDGTCIPPTAIATPDTPEACPAGHYLKEDGSCAVIDFDPSLSSPDLGAAPTLAEMAPDMPPAATPVAGASFDPKMGKLAAQGTVFDGMEIQPYGQGLCPENYNGGKRAVFFAVGQMKMFATIVEDHGACCGSCAVGGACSGCSTPGAMEGDAVAPRGSARIRMGRPLPPHTSDAVRDRTTKVVVANDGYLLSLNPLRNPAATFDDAYGRKIYVGKRMWTAPGLPPPVSVSVGGASFPGVPQAPSPRPGATGVPGVRQGPAMPGGMAPSMGERMPGLPPRNPEWAFRGPEVKV